jgi:tRNA(fMet)-specific endonuclease VapC
MSFVLDTDTCSAYLKGDQNVFNRFVQHSGGLYLSTITLGELYAWVHQAKTAHRHLQGLVDLLADVRAIPVDGEVALRFGRERAKLLDQGIQVPPTDIFIASTALHFDFTVVTHNTMHFKKVPGLRVEDWLTARQ